MKALLAGASACALTFSLAAPALGQESDDPTTDADGIGMIIVTA